jgi:hypothetical protein
MLYCATLSSMCVGCATAGTARGLTYFLRVGDAALVVSPIQGAKAKPAPAISEPFNSARLVNRGGKIALRLGFITNRLPHPVFADCNRSSVAG